MPGPRLYLLLLAAGGCDFEHGQLDDAGPIEANAVDCRCSFADSGSRTLRVLASSDDAEQAGTTMDLTSGDLDLGEKEVGVRFDNFGLPPGAQVQSAFVQFTADQSESGSTFVIIRAQDTANAPTFSTTASDITSRTPLTTPGIPWTIGAWSSGSAGTAQRSPDLSAAFQQLADLPDWRSDSPVVLRFDTGFGHRTARSFDGSRTAAPELVVTYTPEIVAQIPTCATNLDRDQHGYLLSPQESCSTLQTTLAGLNAACGLPQPVTCTLVHRTVNGHGLPDSYQSASCEEPCEANPVDAPTCDKYDPVGYVDCLARGNSLATCKAAHVSATNADGDTPVCVSSGSALAFDAVGPHSSCAVDGTSVVTIGDEHPTTDPATSGNLEVVGGPCVGADCFVHTSFLLGMEPITFEVRFARDPTFVDLTAAAAAKETTLFDAGNADFDPGTVAGIGTGRRGDDGLAIAASNPEVIDVGVDWAAATCDMNGTLAVGVGGDGTCAADATIVCSSDADCAAVGGACTLPPEDDAPMTATVDLAGTLVNQPPDADAGPDQTLECTSAAGQSFELDGGGSSDPDGNLALASWRLGSRTGAELAGDLHTTQALGVGDTQTYVLRVMDAFAQIDEDTTTVSVVDTTPPTVSCNAPATIRPSGTVATFTGTATDVCDTSVPATVTTFDCFKLASNGKHVEKLDACKASASGGTLTVKNSGGAGDHITWTVQAVDDSGNVGTASCEVIVAP
jgi:hypothetical protein